MKILVLCNKPPFPPKDGGSLAMKTLIEGLVKAGHSVKVLAVNDPKFGVESRDIPAEIMKNTSLELIPVDLSLKPLPALWSLLKGNSYHIKRFFNKRFESRLMEVLQEGFDIVQFETLFPSVYLAIIRKYSKAKIVLRAHNIEYQIWEQLHHNEKNFLKKWYLGKLAGHLKKYELELFTKVDGIAAITRNDQAFIELITCKTPVITCPFGVDTSEYVFAVGDNPEMNVFHLGAMNWKPNEEGIQWFLNNVWPLIIKKKPGALLKLAGKHMPQWINDAHYRGLEVVGEVDNSWKWICKNGIMIVPVFSGSGVRIKIIEGMLAAKAVVSTTKGASGIQCTHGFNILLADTPPAFAEAILQCMEQPSLAENMGYHAREFIIKNHDINNIIPSLTEFYKVLLDYH